MVSESSTLPPQHTHSDLHPYLPPPVPCPARCDQHHSVSCCLHTFTGTRRSVEMIFHGFQTIISAYTIYYILHTIHFQTSHGYFSATAWFLFMSSIISFLVAICYGFLAWWTRTAGVKKDIITAMRTRLFHTDIQLAHLQNQQSHITSVSHRNKTGKKIQFAAWMLSRRPRAVILLGVVSLTSLAAFIQGYRIRNGTDCELYVEPLQGFCEATLVAVGSLFITSVLWMLWLAFWFIVSSYSIRQTKARGGVVGFDGVLVGDVAHISRSLSFMVTGPSNAGVADGASFRRSPNSNNSLDEAAAPRRKGSELTRIISSSNSMTSDSNSSTAYSSLRSHREVQILITSDDETQEKDPLREHHRQPREDDSTDENGDEAVFHSIPLDGGNTSGSSKAMESRSVSYAPSPEEVGRRSRSVDLAGQEDIKFLDKISEGQFNTLPRTRHSMLPSEGPFSSSRDFAWRPNRHESVSNSDNHAQQLHGQLEFERLMSEHLKAIGAIRSESHAGEHSGILKIKDTAAHAAESSSKTPLEIIFSPASADASKNTNSDYLRMSCSSPILTGFRRATSSNIKSILNPFGSSLSLNVSQDEARQQQQQRSKSVYTYLHPTRSNIPPATDSDQDLLPRRPRSVSFGPQSSPQHKRSDFFNTIPVPHERNSKAGPKSPSTSKTQDAKRPISSSSEHSLLSPHDQSRLQKFWDDQLPYPPLALKASQSFNVTRGASSTFSDMDGMEKERILKRTSQVFTVQQPQIRQLVRQSSQLTSPVQGPVLVSGQSE